MIYDKKRVNLGCGTKPMVGWMNIDWRPNPGVDIVHDLRQGIPMDDDSIDEIYADNFLEHLLSDDAINLLNEIGRVLKVGGIATIIVPHAHSQGAFQDPTHKSFWVPNSGLYWNQEDTPAGGLTVGITANLMPLKSPEVYGQMAGEAFIKFVVYKKAPR